MEWAFEQGVDNFASGVKFSTRIESLKVVRFLAPLMGKKTSRSKYSHRTVVSGCPINAVSTQHNRY
jgi:hypothetical protein